MDLRKLKYIIPMDKNPLLAECILRCKYKEFLYQEFGLNLYRKELCFIIEGPNKPCIIM
jgi:hypothetical protein